MRWNAKSARIHAVLALFLGACGGSGSGDSPPPVPYVEATGIVDASFGTNGMAQIPVSREGRVTAIAELDDGSLLVGGTNPFVAKLTPQGQLDASFATNGIDLTNRGTRMFHEVARISPLSPQRIAIVEQQFNICAATALLCPILEFGDVVARRIDAAGNADPTYGDAGLGVLATSEGAIVVTPSGRVVSFTMRPILANPSTFGVASLDPAGQRDVGFETRALAALQCSGRFDPQPSQVDSVSAANTGEKIIVAAAWGATFAGAVGVCVSRLNADGTIDPSFGESGHQVFSGFGIQGPIAFRIFVRGSGDIVVALKRTADSAIGPLPALLFLTASGAKDSSIAPGGMQLQPVIPVEYILDLTLQPDGKIVALGENSLVPGSGTYPYDADNPRVARSSVGATNFDAGFGPAPGGSAALGTPAGSIRANKLFVDRRGGVLAGGYNPSTIQPAVVRLR